MSKSWNRLETWVAVIAIGVGLVVAAVLGLHLYVTTTAESLHPDPDAVPSTPAGPAAPEWAEAVARARRLAREGIGAQNLPGLSVAVGVNGEIVWAEGFGWAELETRAPVTPATRFRIGTASIPLTSAAVGLLLEEGAMTLDDPVQRHVPEYPEKPWPVRLGHLMGHVAGVKNDGGDEGPLLSQRCDIPTDGIRYFAEAPLRFEPGTQFRFSSYGWILVSAAVEAAANEPFLSFVQRRIFEPAGMRDTAPDSASAPDPARATPYFPRYAADPRYGLHLMRPVDYSCYAGAGVFLSTPSDMVRFGMAVAGGTLLRPETRARLQSPQRLASGEETGYGLGWDLETVELHDESTRWVGHDGTVLGGRVAALITIPERGIAVSVMSNISYADPEALAVSIASAFAGHAPRQPP